MNKVIAMLRLMSLLQLSMSGIARRMLEGQPIERDDINKAEYAINHLKHELGKLKVAV